MSETIRVYSGYGSRKYKQKGGFFRFILKISLLAIVVFSIGFFYSTRDLYPAEQFLPSASAFEIFSPQLMQNYQHIIQSPLWNLIPPSSNLYEVKKLLSDQQIVPLWIIKHLIYDFFYLSVKDLQSFENTLFVIRLSRIGCVIESLYSWTQPVEIDWAGGLNLKYIPGQKLYYARKGRILLLSPDRSTLIQSITQKKDNKTQTIIARELLKNQEKHLAWGTLTLPQANLRGLISQVHFYLTLTPKQLGFKCETRITPNPEVPWTVLLTEMVSTPLQEPADTLLSCSLNTGVPLKTWLHAFEIIPQIHGISPPPSVSEVPFMEWIKSFAPFIDNQFYLTIDTFYTDEIIPFIPKYCIVTKTQPNICENVIQTIIEPTIIILGEKNKAFSNAGMNEYIVPLIGSSQTDLHIQCIDEGLLFTNNTELRNHMLEYMKNKSSFSEENSSLILQVKPEKLLTEINNAIAVLIDSNILRFHNPEKVNDIFNKIKLFKEIKIKVSLNKGNLKIAGITEFSDNIVQIKE